MWSRIQTFPQPVRSGSVFSHMRSNPSTAQSGISYLYFGVVVNQWKEFYWIISDNSASANWSSIPDFSNATCQCSFGPKATCFLTFYISRRFLFSDHEDQTAGRPASGSYQWRRCRRCCTLPGTGSCCRCSGSRRRWSWCRSGSSRCRRTWGTPRDMDPCSEADGKYLRETGTAVLTLRSEKGDFFHWGNFHSCLFKAGCWSKKDFLHIVLSLLLEGS